MSLSIAYLSSYLYANELRADGLATQHCTYIPWNVKIVLQVGGLVPCVTLIGWLSTGFMWQPFD